MKDGNFLREMNATHLWHPMGHPDEQQVQAPKIIKSAEGSQIADIDGHRVVDAVCGLWCANLENEAIEFLGGSGRRCDPCSKRDGRRG